MKSLDDFFIRYSNGDRSLGSRLSTMKIAVSLLNRSKSNNFIETGTTRKNILSHPSVEERAADGGSTIFFSHYCSIYGGKVWTCDIDSQNITNCKAATEEYKNFINYIVDDSINFLKSFNNDIDFLYLDSVDSSYDFASDHQLQEIEAAYDKLNNRSIILLDDLGDKTTKSIPYLQSKNWCQININVPNPSNYNNVVQGIFVHESFLYTNHSIIPVEKRFKDL